MEIHLTPEIEGQLRHVASSEGKALPEFVEETLVLACQLFRDQEAWLLQDSLAIREDIRVGIAQLDRGEGIPDSELDAALARLKTQAE